MGDKHSPGRGAFLLAFASIYLIWGSTYLGIRVAVQTIPPFLMGAGRFIIAGGVLFAIVQAKAERWPTARQWRDNLLIGTFLLLGGNGFVALAETTLPSSLTALIIAIQPIFMVVTEWGWPGGKRPTNLTSVGLILGLAGVAWLVAPWESGTPGASVDLKGVAYVLLACVSWAFGSIWSRHIKHPAPAFQASAIQMLGGSASLFLGGTVRGEWAQLQFSNISSDSIVAFFYLAFIGSLVGFSTFVWLMKNSTPARVSTYAYVNPVVAVFLGWLVLHEPITSRVIFAAVVIVTAVAIITTGKGRGEKRGPAPKADDAVALADELKEKPAS
jgi:drug/metabolite transporter (DMT)-like permease